MLIIMTGKKLKRLLSLEYEEGMVRGYLLGHMAKQGKVSNKGFIIGSKVEYEIRKILKDKGVI